MKEVQSRPSLWQQSQKPKTAAKSSMSVDPESPPPRDLSIYETFAMEQQYILLLPKK